MKLLDLQEAERSVDIDVMTVAMRSSRYRMFGSKERIPEGELAVADVRDGVQPVDFDERFQVLDRHPIKPVMLVRKR